MNRPCVDVVGWSGAGNESDSGAEDGEEVEILGLFYLKGEDNDSSN